MTTIVGRICLDLLRARQRRREDFLDLSDFDRVVAPDKASDPQEEAVLADSVGLALLVVLDTLGPAERVAFVLHDLFAVPFNEIAPIVDRSLAATKQLASRARRRVRGAPAVSAADLGRQRMVVAGGQIAQYEVISDPGRLGQLRLGVLDLAEPAL